MIRTFRDKLPEIFDGRTEVPKTLIFAKTDLHAEDMVEIVRTEFGKGNDFCQKITRQAARRSENCPQAVPERVLATNRCHRGHDRHRDGREAARMPSVPPDVRSLSYFEQMKGRGCRVASLDEMAKVNQEARPKTHFVIVDAVGVV